METASPPRYFWDRLPYGLVVSVRTSAVWASCVFLLVASLATAAQWTSDAAVTGTSQPVVLHALAMAAVAALSVGVSAALVRQRHPELAVVVILAAVLGPMTLVAVPILPGVVAPSFDDTTLGWHLVVALMLSGLLALWTRHVVLGFEGEETVEGTRPRQPAAFADRVLPPALFALVSLLGVSAYLVVPAQANEPALRAVLGWSVIAAGVVVSVGWARTWGAAAVALVGGSAALLAVVVAYTRVGGWPGVAGWERDGMQSPIITCWSATFTLLLAPFLGGTVHAARRGLAARTGAPERTDVPALRS